MCAAVLPRVLFLEIPACKKLVWQLWGSVQEQPSPEPELSCRVVSLMCCGQEMDRLWKTFFAPETAFQESFCVGAAACNQAFLPVHSKCPPELQRGDIRGANCEGASPSHSFPASAPWPLPPHLNLSREESSGASSHIWPLSFLGSSPSPLPVLARPGFLALSRACPCLSSGTPFSGPLLCCCRLPDLKT